MKLEFAFNMETRIEEQFVKLRILVISRKYPPLRLPPLPEKPEEKPEENPIILKIMKIPKKPKMQPMQPMQTRLYELQIQLQQPIIHAEIQRFDDPVNRLNLYLDPNFLSEQMSQNLFTILNGLEWSPTRRQKYLYADPGLVYTINFKGKNVEYATRNWDQLPILLTIKKLIEQLTGDVYTVCVVQHYPSGRYGINPHRDKEMKPGTTIAGLSLGETRTLTMARRDQKIPIRLNSGSLYILYPPTNDYWSHSIEKDATLGARISLTYRNY